jgi:hypothetical protein
MISSRQISSSHDPYFEIVRRLHLIEAQLKQLLETSRSTNWVSVLEASRALDRTPHTIRLLCAKGKIAAIKSFYKNGAYHHWRIPRSEIVRMQEGISAVQTKSSAETVLLQKSSA